MGFGGCLGSGSRRELLGRAGQSLTAWIPKYANTILLHTPYRPSDTSRNFFRYANDVSIGIRKKIKYALFESLIINSNVAINRGQQIT